MLVPAGGSVDKLAPHAHASSGRGCGGAGETTAGCGRSGGGPKPPEGGGDLQHGGREVEEKERSAGGLNGHIHHCQRFTLSCLSSQNCSHCRKVQQSRAYVLTYTQ